MANTKLVFCAREQKDTEHTVSIDANGEFIFQCACGEFLKMPASVTADDVTELLIKHKEGNIGQVTLEAQQKKLDEILGIVVPSDTPDAEVVQ